MVKVKAIKCPVCDGHGNELGPGMNIGRARIQNISSKKCGRCNGTGKLNALTNQSIILEKQDDVKKFSKEIKMILKVLGHPEALVTDGSMITDFAEGVSKDKRLKSEIKLCKKLGKEFGIKIPLHTFIIDLAQDIRYKRNFERNT
jgi:hypothetical protein